MEEKFQIVGWALPSLVSFAALLTAIGGCSGGGSGFGDGGSGGSNSPSAGTNGTQTGGGSSSTGGNTTTGGNGNTGGISNPGGGNAGTPGGSGDGPVAGSGGSAPAEVCPKPPGEICHEFFANDNGNNQVNYVNEFKIGQMKDDGEVIGPEGVIWVKKVEVQTVNSPRQVELVGNDQATNKKAILLSVNTGFQEYDMLTGARLVNVVLPGGTKDIRGAVRLPNGNTILAVGDNKLRTVDNAGATIAECTLPGSGGDSLRVLNRDAATGHLLLGRLLDLFVVTEQCQQQWTAKLPSGSKAYSVFPAKDGASWTERGVWATSGAPSSVIHFDGAGQIVEKVGGKDVHANIGLDFFSGFEFLPNGNIVAANWQGHLTMAGLNTPHLVEFSPDNKLVWKWGNAMVARQITNTMMLR